MAEQWRDDPIKAATDDRLGRVGLAKRVAALVSETYSPDSSVVHGLVGPWGSGKSSVLALTEQEFANQGDEWVIVRFTPWVTNDINGLFAEFHGAIIEALPNSDKSGEFRRGLGEVLDAASPIVSALGALVGVAAAGQIAEKGSELLRREKSWLAKFEKASNVLKLLKVKILVIADDVDRLHGEELLNFLKLVRLVGRFPGMSYLLAYDEAGLLSSIQSAGSAVDGPERAQDFLEKFVQYPVYLPPLIEGQILDLLNDAIEPAVSASRHTYGGPAGRLSFNHVWTVLLDTPRAVSRFAAQLRLVLPLHQAGEVDLVDVMLLTLLRLHAPTVFDAVSRRKDLLTGSRTGTKGFNWDELIDSRTPPDLTPAIRELIERLFPSTRPNSASNLPAPCVSDPDYFDRYFLQGIPKDDIADHTVRWAISQVKEGDARPLEVLLLAARSDSQRASIISKLKRFSKWGSEPGDTPIVALEALLSEMHRLPRRSGSFLPSAHDNAFRWASEMIVCLPPDVPAQAFREALGRCSDKAARERLLESTVWETQLELPSGVKEVAIEEALEALEAIVANVRQGDSAETGGVAERWTLLTRHFALEDARERLARELADGMSADDLAARFVAIAHWVGAGAEREPEMNGMLWEALDEMLPDGLPTSDAPSGNIDLRDVSWSSRRKYALGQLSQRRGGD